MFIKKHYFVLEVLSPYKKLIFLLIFISLVAASLEGFSIGMLIPLLGGFSNIDNYEQLPRPLRILTSYFVHLPLDKMLLFCAGIVVIAIILKNVCVGIARYIGYGISSSLVADLRSKAVRMLLEVGIAFYHKSKAGRLVDKVMHNAGMLDELFRQAVEFVVSFISGVTLLILLIIISWKLTLLSALLSIFISFAISSYVKSLSKLGRKNAENHQLLSFNVFELISGITIIKTFVQEDRQFRILKKQINRNKKSNHILNFYNSIIYNITESFAIILIGIIFLIIFLFYIKDYNYFIVQFLPFLYILNRIMSTLKDMNQQRGTIISLWPNLNIVYDLIRYNNKPLIKNGSILFHKLTNGILFDTISFYYDSNKKNVALNNIDFFIPKGKTTAIIGESGTGKTTLISLLLRFYDPQKGTIFIDNTPLADLEVSSYRSNISYVSQDIFIFNNSVQYNISFGTHDEPSDNAVIKAAKLAGAHDFIQKLPNGYDTVLGDRGVKLSGGQRQRISIARALLNPADILILDEATSSLDSKVENLIHYAISSLSRELTLIIIAHRLSTTRNADQIVVLRDGRIVEIGNAQQLLDNKGEFYHLSLAQEGDISRAE